MKKFNPLLKPWKVMKCNTEDCWCAWISLVPEDDDHWICPSGSITKREAKHIVRLHNNWLKRRKK